MLYEKLLSFFEFFNIDDFHKQSFLSVCILLFFYRFYFSLFFTLSIGHLLAGYRFQEADGNINFLKKRLIAGSRSLMIPLLPVFILNLFFKDFEDKFLKTTFICKKNDAFRIIRFLMIFISIILIYISPLFYKFDFNQKDSLIIGNMEKVKNIKSKENEVFASRKMGIFFSNDLKSKKFKILPSYNVKRFDGHLIYRPSVLIWDSNSQELGKLEKTSKIALFSLIIEMRSRYKKFNESYPYLNEIILEIERKKISIKEIEFKSKIKDEVFEILLSSFILNKSLFSFILKTKRFNFYPYYYFKSKLFEEILKGYNLENNKIHIFKNEDSLVIKISRISHSLNKFVENFFVVNNLNPSIYLISWDNKKQNIEMKENFWNYFFSRSIWNKNSHKIISEYIRNKNYTPLSILDHIDRSYPENNLFIELDKYIRAYYYKEGEKILYESKKYQKIFINSIQTILKVWKVTNKKNDFKNKLNYLIDIIIALKNKDKSFFENKGIYSE